jgi:hypothetical protein
MAKKDKNKGGKHSDADLQQALDSFIEGEHGGEPVKGRKHTFDLTKETKKEADKKGGKK